MKKLKECGKHNATSRKHAHYRVSVVVSKEVVDESINTQFSNEEVEEYAIGAFSSEQDALELASRLEDHAQEHLK